MNTQAKVDLYALKKKISINKLDTGTNIRNILSDTIKSMLTSIVLESSIPTSLDSSITQYDISLNKDGSIIAYIDSNNIMHWCSNGIIEANGDISALFYGFNKATTITFNGLLDTSNVTNMDYMFQDCYKLTSLDLSSFNTTNVTDMSYMFHNCSSLSTLDISNFNTSNVTIMTSMFSYCESLKTLDLSSFNTTNVTSMENMFYYCTSLSTLDLSSFNTSNVTDMSDMFSTCTSLTSLNISSFNTSNVKDIYSMFYECNSVITEFTISGILSGGGYSALFIGAATIVPAKIIVNYTAATASVIDEYIAEKSTDSNVVKGIQV